MLRITTDREDKISIDLTLSVNPNIILAKIQELSWWKHLLETQVLTRFHQDNCTDSTSLMLGFTHIALDRERKEIDRLRKEHAQTIAELRERAEVDRSDARDALGREREEITRLRTELSAVRKQAEQATVRADTLATTNDTLRGQLVQLQMKEQPTQK